MMGTRLQTLVQAAPTPTLAPARPGVLQRKCACGGFSEIAGGCSECGKEREGLRLQRATRGSELGTHNSGSVPPIVHKVLRSPGQPLDGATRAFFEPRFGHDFSRVRVHADPQASESARAVNALAYTVGTDIVFGAGAQPWGTTSGNRLLAHELTHVVQQRGGQGGSLALEPGISAEREAETVGGNVGETWFPRVPLRISRYPTGLYRQQAAPAAAPSGMSRTDFDATMKKRFGVTRIVTGTMQQQASSLTPRGGAPPGGVVLPNWQQWDPGSASQVYSSIIEAFEDFAASVGGLPGVREIIFFNVDYEVNQAGIGIPKPTVGASFGGGEMVVYRALTTMNKALPISRSNVQGSYPSVGVGVVGPGSTPGAPSPLPSRVESAKRVVSHELGHGLAEVAMAVDPTTFAKYQREVGWTPGFPTQLFDIGVPAVATALAAGTAPPAAHEITENNWNSPQWIEQPLSSYMVSGGPGEDFSEAIMTFVHAPNLLLSRSPARFKFINNGKDTWLPRLLKLPQIGDFPEPKPGDARAA